MRKESTFLSSIMWLGVLHSQWIEFGKQLRRTWGDRSTSGELPLKSWLIDIDIEEAIANANDDAGSVCWVDERGKVRSVEWFDVSIQNFETIQ